MTLIRSKPDFYTLERIAAHEQISVDQLLEMAGEGKLRLAVQLSNAHITYIWGDEAQIDTQALRGREPDWSANGLCYIDQAEVDGFRFNDSLDINWIMPVEPEGLWAEPPKYLLTPSVWISRSQLVIPTLDLECSCIITLPLPLVDIAQERYLLRDAARYLSENVGGEEFDILLKLSQAAIDRDLPVFAPGSSLRCADVKAHLDVVETYWNDLNLWLKQHEPRVRWRFPDPAELAADHEAVNAQTTQKISNPSPWILLARKEALRAFPDRMETKQAVVAKHLEEWLATQPGIGVRGNPGHQISAASIERMALQNWYKTNHPPDEFQ